MIYKAKTFLELHEELLENGIKAFNNDLTGLCLVCSMIPNRRYPMNKGLSSNPILKELMPVDKWTIYHWEQIGVDVTDVENDYIKLMTEKLNLAYWASDSNDAKLGEYTSLRQNIILLCAALNGEFDE